MTRSLTRFIRPSIAAFALAAMIAPALTQAGTFSTATFTNDADSGIAAANAYTLAINTGDTGNLTVNDAVFTGPGGSFNPSTNNYAFTGNTAVFGGYNPGGISGAVDGLFNGFTYGGNTQTLTLNNLRIGERYRTTFYNAHWDNVSRQQDITVSDGGSLLNYNQDGFGSPGDGHTLYYDFVATANTQTFTIQIDNVNSATFHQYAFSNQLVKYEALLTDNFYAPNPGTDGEGINFNLEARQGGLLAVGAANVSWTNANPTGGSNNAQVGNNTGGIDGGNYLLTAFNTNAALNQNFNGALSKGGLLVAVDMAPNVGGIGSSVWGSISLGMDSANRHNFVAGGAPHFGILFRGSGTIQVFDGGTTLVNDTINWTGLTNVTTQLHRFELLLTDSTDGNPFDGVGQTEIAVYADGVFIYSFIKTGGGYADNFMNFGGTHIAGFDNLLIARMIPSPAALPAGLALIGLALSRRRR